MSAPWPPDFEAVLRATIPALDGAALEPDVPLTIYGVTSLGLLGLGSAVSTRYGIPLAAFTERAFRSAGSLWALVRERATDAPPLLDATVVSTVADHGPRATSPDGARSFPSLAERFAHTARRHPDAVAIDDGTESVTYAQLATQVADLAGQLGSGGVVAVLGERDNATYLAYLAALYAGAAVVPLHMEFPPARNADIVRRAGARLVVHTDAADDPMVASQIAAFDGVPVLDARSTRLTAPADATAGATPFRVDPDDVAYLIFTSGSTGHPKGVSLTHRNVDTFLGSTMPTLHVGPGDVVSQCHGLTFDFSVFEMWGAWSSGATAAAVSRLDALDPSGTIARRGITVWSCTPSLLETAAAAGSWTPRSATGLRYLVIGGEALASSTLRAARQAAPHAVIDNVYGPTETTVWTTTFRSLPGDPVPDTAVVPIGRPLPTVRLRVDGTGELAIGGPQVSRGYVDATLDAGRFVSDDGIRWYRTGDLATYDDAGLLHYGGRIDAQVKVRGHRVELAEIEVAASRILGGTRTAAVLTTRSGPEAGLVLAVESSSVDEVRLRRELGRVLPTYMVPDRIAAIESFRLTAHSKLDRVHLVGEVSRHAGVPGRHDR